ncbi:hypothetical protein ABBQ32_010823 [Trebouxia sp. C0010 RCD-2024]
MASENGLGTSLLSNGSRAKTRNAFASSASVVLAVLLVLLAVFTKYTEKHQGDDDVQRYYTWYLHVAIMIFVGFGFLMTFLKHYSYSALGLNFFCSCIVILEALLVVGAVQQMWVEGHRKIWLDLPLMIDAAFCAGAAMITFGAVLGKVSPSQLMYLLILEVPLYAVNQHLVVDKLKALDVGGSITIHAFGAYYGLAASMVLSTAGSGVEHRKNGASYTSDMTAMIGTIFLWLFWPSFNGALASDPAALMPEAGGGQRQFLCVMNTILALLGSSIAAFASSSAFSGKFNMVHIQNATVAGGVAIGSAANLNFTPAGAVGVGVLAGVLSTAGLRQLTPAMERRFGLRDTCGVHNLHGLPGLLGGIVAAVVSWTSYGSNKGVMLAGHQQALHQGIAAVLTLTIAIVGGVVAATAVKVLTPKTQKLKSEHMFDDGQWWDIEQEDDTEPVL